jgi:hypothetical protein
LDSEGHLIESDYSYSEDEDEDKSYVYHPFHYDSDGHLILTDYSYTEDEEEDDAADDDDDDDKDDNDDNKDDEDDEDEDDDEPSPLRDPPFSAYPRNRQEEILRRRGWFVATSPDYPPSRRQAINPRFRPSQVVSTVNNVDIHNTNNEDNDAVYSLSTVSFQDINQADLLRQEEHNDDQSSISSVSTVDFNGVEFGPIIQDLRLIRQNGRIRLPNGTYHSVDSRFSFTPSQIRYTVTCYPGTFLRRYFRGPWPNFH